MRAVVQRVASCKVTVGERTTGEIGSGLLVLLGIGKTDTAANADELIAKLCKLRIFSDTEGKMNLSLTDIEGDMMIVSQFTLYADTSRGRRPSFMDVASPDAACELYEYFVDQASKLVNRVATGEFGAMMNVSLVNDGPVTLIVDAN